MQKRTLLFIGILIPAALVLAACTPVAAAVATVEPTALPVNTVQPPATATPAPTATATPAPTDSPTATPTAVRLPPERWQEWPVIPTLSAKAREVYQRGVQAGNRPEAFSKVGDCESRTTWFLADFDKGAAYYSLGSYADLQSVIDHFKGSFERLSVAARPGFTAASLMTPLWNDPKLCKIDETPLACEYRLQRPAFALVMMGTNDISRPKEFEANMRKVIEYTLAQGIVPVLTTKADNLEGDDSINATVARLAYEYDVPLWNFWLAVQPLPDHGLQEDRAHLTFGNNHFENADNLKKAWTVRNLTALQVLQAVWQGVESAQ